MRKSIITSIIIGLAPLWLASCGGDNEEGEVINAQQAQQQKTAQMQAARAKLQEKGHEFSEAGILALLNGPCEAEILNLYLQAGVPVTPQILFDLINRLGTEPNDARRAELIKCVEVMIKNGVNVNAADGAGTTALHLAAKSWSPEVVKLLLAAGANPKAANKQGATPEVYAFGTEMRAAFGLEKIDTTPAATLPEAPATPPANTQGVPELPAETPAIPSVGEPTEAHVPTAEETLTP